MTMSGSATGVLTLDLTGEPLQGGGVLLNSSQVTMGPTSQPSLYHGSISGLRGTRIDASVQSAGQPTLQLVVDVQIAPNGTSLTGTVSAQTGQGAGQ